MKTIQNLFSHKNGIDLENQFRKSVAERCLKTARYLKFNDKL